MKVKRIVIAIVCCLVLIVLADKVSDIKRENVEYQKYVEFQREYIPQLANLLSKIPDTPREELGELDELVTQMENIVYNFSGIEVDTTVWGQWGSISYNLLKVNSGEWSKDETELVNKAVSLLEDYEDELYLSEKYSKNQVKTIDSNLWRFTMDLYMELKAMQK